MDFQSTQGTSRISHFPHHLPGVLAGQAAHRQVHFRNRHQRAVGRRSGRPAGYCRTRPDQVGIFLAVPVCRRLQGRPAVFPRTEERRIAASGLCSADVRIRSGSDLAACLAHGIYHGRSGGAACRLANHIRRHRRSGRYNGQYGAGRNSTAELRQHHSGVLCRNLHFRYRRLGLGAVVHRTENAGRSG